MKMKDIFASVKSMRKNRITSVFTLLLALHILNISVDPIDSVYLPASSRMANEMESITEIIFEKVLHIKNIFTENKYDNNNKGTLLANHFSLINYYKPFAAFFPVINSCQLHFKPIENFFTQHSSDVLTPPPDVIS